MRRPSLPLVAAALLAAVPLLGAPAPGRVAVGTVPTRLASFSRLGPADPDQRLDRIIVVLSLRDPGGLSRLLSDLSDPRSPRYHRWLTPEEFGGRFGASGAEIACLVAWLEGEGLEVDALPAGRGALLVSGRAADVGRAFGTAFARVEHEGTVHLANTDAPSVPKELGGVVAGVLSLDGFQKRRPFATALVTNGTAHSLSPADFATIYDSASLLASGVDGRGQKIAVISRTNLSLDDARRFRQSFGLPPNDPVVLLNGTDPGAVGGIDRVESNIDMQWSGGVAPGASVVLVVSKTTATTDGIDLSALYAVDANVADVISLSYGDCEADLTPADQVFYSNVWAQAAAQGISVVVASGDSGAAGCEGSNQQQGLSLAVNGLSSSPYATCAGGTQFDDGPDPTVFWSGVNDPVTQGSARSYIPETAWNESRQVGGFGLLATGGGLSKYFPRPLWQVAPGLGAGAWRALPDISVNASSRVPYTFYDSGALQNRYAGTSFSAPVVAGVAALLLQRGGGRQGNLNPRLYELGRAQYGAGSAATVAAFHDVTRGSNSVPGVTGFDAGSGYDLATGLGSPAVSALANAWAAGPPVEIDFILTASPAVLSLAAGGSATVAVSLQGRDGRDVTASLAVEGLPVGLTARFSPAYAGGSGSGVVSPGVPAVLTLSASAPAQKGMPRVFLTATAGTVTRRVELFVTVQGGDVAAPAGVELQVPVVLDVFGAAGSHFTSDLVAVNRSASDASLLLRYSAAPGSSGSGGPVVARSLPSGRQLFVPDVLASLGSAGYSFDAPPAAKLGTLFLVFASVDDPHAVFAGSRATTPNPDAAVGGSYGTFFGATRTGTATETETWVYGLRETPSQRSNLAAVHSPGGASSASAAGPVSIEIQLFDGDAGVPAGAPIAATLAPGEFRQWSRVLSGAGISNGYARVRRTAGTDRFIAYGVVNDGGGSGGGTSDGSFIASGGSDGLVPIVLDLPGNNPYRSELVLVNPSLTAPAAVTMTYTPASQLPEAGGGGSAAVTLTPGQQLVREDALGFLRERGLAIPAGGSQGGTLLIAGAYALVRTFSPNADQTVGGTFGVAYPAVANGERATSSAWVYGLRQDDQVRSNLAISDGRLGDAHIIEYAVDVYDGERGGAPVKTFTLNLRGGDWAQITTILAQAGLTSGYARVRTTEASSFVAYGVINDGPSPGTRTSDGSYVGMVVEK